jgi:hypothetical protein
MRVANVSSEESEQKKGGAVPGEQVVEDEHQRLDRRRLLQEPRGCLEEIETSCVRVRCVRGPGGLTEAIRELGNEQGQVGDRRRAKGPESLVIETLEQTADDLCPHPVRRFSTAFPGATPEDPRPAIARMAGHVVRERGLADARLTGEQENAAATYLRILEARQKLGPFPIPSDETCSHAYVPVDRFRHPSTLKARRAPLP